MTEGLREVEHYGQDGGHSSINHPVAPLGWIFGLWERALLCEALLEKFYLTCSMIATVPSFICDLNLAGRTGARSAPDTPYAL